MPVTKAEFNKFIDEAMEKFKQYRNEVDEGLKEIETHINTVVTDTVAYLSGGFKKGLMDAFELHVKKRTPISSKLIDIREKVTKDLGALCDDKLTYDLTHKLLRNAFDYSEELSKKLARYDIKPSSEIPIPFLATFFRIAWPPSPDYNPPDLPDLRDRKNWNLIIEKLIATGKIKR